MTTTPQQGQGETQPPPPPPEELNTEVKCKVSTVTVFSDRAMITRTGTCALHHTQTSLQLTGLPEYIDMDTLRVGAAGPAQIKILDFKLSTVLFSDVPDDAIAALEQQLLTLTDAVEDEQNAIRVLEHQMSYIKGISPNLVSEANRPTVEEWKSVATFIQSELLQINALIRQKRIGLRSLQKDIEQVQAQLDKCHSSRSTTRQLVTVNFQLEENGTFEFELSYLNYSVNWTPLYDARVDSKAKNVEISYFGVVSQSTGEEWAGAVIYLSTARPQLGGNAPKLSAWNISVLAPPPPLPRATSHQMMGANNVESDACMPMACAMMACAPPPPGGYARSQRKRAMMPSCEVVPAQEGQGANVVFKTSGCSRIPGTGEPTKLLIMRNEFGNRFNFITVPKSAEHVYLNAEVINTTDFPLLPGRISLFLDNSFVGYSSMTQLVLPGETFDLQLGVDESIKVTQKLLRRMKDESGIFSKSKSLEYSYEIVLESFRDNDELILVHDQIPVSQDEKIKVDVLEITPPEHKEKDTDKIENGVIEWKVILPQKQKIRLLLNYRITCPKNIEIAGLH